jgi:hypothetical protein
MFHVNSGESSIVIRGSIREEKTNYPKNILAHLRSVRKQNLLD